jgi:hypothetical protein
MDRVCPKVVADDRPFDSEFHASAVASGADVIRLETPSSPADFVCNSIWQTDRVATLLELVLGLRTGLVLMNRRSSALRLPLPQYGEDARDAMQILKATSVPGEVHASPLPAGSADPIVLRAGEALCWLDPYAGQTGPSD